ncbi:MAG: DNA polymerase III subunit delta' [Sphingomicrobium sp.]
MTIAGQDKAVSDFSVAWAGRKLHHAWLLAGPRGVGKASFAAAAARRVLAEAAGPGFDLIGIDSPPAHPMVKLIDAGSHPDMRQLERLPHEKTGNLARNISVAQVRKLGEFMGMAPAMSAWRVVIIDSIDDLETSAANALLKILEEPPAGTIFFLVSHAPGKLLPTIRSRCRRLEFGRLDADAMTSILAARATVPRDSERRRLVALANGSAGKALAFAELGLSKLEDQALAILRQGDPTNALRADLASDLGKKGSAERYAAFLDLVPALIAREARSSSGAQRERALDAYGKARQLAAIAPRVSLDPAVTVFQMGGLLASVSAIEGARRGG